MVYRFFNPVIGGHFYTSDIVEQDYILENLTDYQLGSGSYQTIDKSTPGVEEVYRFFNSSRAHFYTTNILVVTLKETMLLIVWLTLNTRGSSFTLFNLPKK